MGFNREDFLANIKNYWAELDESQRVARQWALALGALVLLAVPGWFLGRPAWHRWQREQALKQVVVFSQKNDYRNATLALRRAVELAPNDPATWQEAVRLLGEIGSPEVLQAREQLARLEPEDVGLKLALAGEALRFDRLDLAEETLKAIGDEARRDEAFFRLAAALALALGRSDELEGNLAKLAAAAPGDPAAKFALAAVRLWSGDGAKLAAARTEIEALTAEPKVRVRAALELLKDATRQHDAGRTTAVMELLLQRFAPELGAKFPAVSRAAWMTLVEKLQTAAAVDGPGEAAALARWLADVGQTREALVWLESVRMAPGAAGGPVREMAAQLSAEIGDLDRVERYLREGAWGEWPREALTLAMAARLQRLRHNEVHARATWEDAVAATADAPTGLRALVRLAEAWHEPEAMELALQTATEKGAGAMWAFEALETIYGGRRELTKLWTLYDAWQRLRRSDDRLAAKWITLGCILNRAGPEAFARAEELKAEGGAGAAVAATLARAAVRWRQGRPRETLAFISGLPAEVREQPGAALWLGLAQADLGNRSAAAAALGTAAGAAKSGDELALVRAGAAKAKIALPVN